MKILDNLVGNLGEALNEDVDDIDNADEIAAAEITLAEIIERERPRRKRYVAAAVALIIFAVVGIVNIVSFGSRLAYDVSNKTALKNDIAAFVYPVVITDPAGFSSDNPPSQNVIISSAVWRILLTENLDRYNSETDNIYIPDVDVEKAAGELFGVPDTSDFSVLHKSVGDVEWTFSYEPDKKSYRVPRHVRVSTYAPSVRDVSVTEDGYSATVDYIVPTARTGIAGVNVDTAPVKTMVYTLKQGTGGERSIASVEYSGDLTADGNN